MASFPETIRHYFGSGERGRLERAVMEPFDLCLAGEPDGFLVADGGKAGVVGYIFAPARTDRLPRVAVLHGFLLRWFWRWLAGQYGFGLGPVGPLVATKLDFLQGARRKESGPPVQARILSLAVHPDHQGRGVAGRLSELALQRLDRLGVAPVRLEVRPENAPALRLYNRLGFRETGRYADSQGEWLVMLRG